MVQILNQQVEAQAATQETVASAVAQAAPTEGQGPSSPLLMTFVSWLFLIGSLIFQMDALLELMEGWSQGLNLHVVFHLSASLLFTVGSLLFVIQDGQQSGIQ